MRVTGSLLGDKSLKSSLNDMTIVSAKNGRLSLKPSIFLLFYFLKD
jgi:hypothetical protein